MRKVSLFSIALSVAIAFSFYTVSAQFPKIKLPKVKPTPDAGTTTPETSDDSGPMKPSRGGGPYATRVNPTDTPVFLADTLEIRTDTQDYYWKLPKESNYTSWTPHVKFDVIYNGSMKLRYKAEYTMPDGSPWFSESLEQRSLSDSRTGASGIESEYVTDKDKGKAIVTGGLFGIKITNLRDNSTVFQGKFKVVKYRPEEAPAQYKNFADFYVDQDWNLPIGYAVVNWDTELSDPSPEQADPAIRMWFKGGINSGDLEARLFHDGQQIATTDDGGNVQHPDSRWPKHAANNPALKWEEYEFTWPKKILFIGNDHARAMTSNNGKLYINQMPGEYVVKVYYKGEQVRETKFNIADGNFADNGIAKQSNISTDKILLPVKVMGTADKWNGATWKTDAFYGNPPTGLNP